MDQRHSLLCILTRYPIPPRFRYLGLFMGWRHSRLAAGQCENHKAREPFLSITAHWLERSPEPKWQRSIEETLNVMKRRLPYFAIQSNSALHIYILESAGANVRSCVVSWIPDLAGTRPVSVSHQIIQLLTLIGISLVILFRHSRY